QLEVDADLLATYPPDSDMQQSAVIAIQDQDGYNWGYDPVHYTVPEGSYATDPDGSTRILEFRAMIKELNQRGLRVVMDVVYNHTNSAGQNENSVLDKIVPGYYHRLDADGNIETSSCCPNTASEHTMMEKLMTDSLLTWARAYKVDGFRFDLMGHHSKANMLNIRAQLDALTEASDGMDGSKISLYGEGWNFGEVANNARFVQATQANMAGTGIGTFNDRLRDGVRGGNPYSDIREQGFITGLHYDPNNSAPPGQLDTLLHLSDWIRISLTGNLKNYTFMDQNGNMVTGEQVDYFGQQAGYTLDPQEAINYVASHDYRTLFDAAQLKTPAATTMADRVRIQNLGLSIVALGQGIPFVHAGMDMLRSKSMDRDSFNSGDWFNKLDFTYQANNWGVGLPLASKNQDQWPIMQPLLANPALTPAPTDIVDSIHHFRDVLQIRKSSGLFRLPTETEVSGRITFHNTGPAQIPGLIVMSLTDDQGDIDRNLQRIVVLCNASDEPVDFMEPALVGASLELHPIQVESMDPVVRTSSFHSAIGTFSIPARTTSVFVAQRPAEEQTELLIDDVEQLLDDEVINHGQANSLLAKLNAIINKIERGRTKAACNQLLAFINHVTSMTYEDNILTENEAQPLIEAATNARAALDCPKK
ncbi:MAG: pullulanase-type alpha-1,6-glucosidase, partial [Planctomycetota bacterium]